MAYWQGNPNSYWIKGELFEAWAEQNKMSITDNMPEFVWVDLETTGLDPRQDVTLEMGIVLTDRLGSVCRNGVIDWKVWTEIRNNKTWQRAVDNMDPYVEDMHTSSGLLKDLKIALTRDGASRTNRMHPADVAHDATDWLTMMVPKNVQLQLSGSSPHFDRGFLRADMPALEAWFHYRSGVDVSGIREVAKRVNQPIINGQPKAAAKHRPIPDLIDSIRLYRYLLRNFIVMTPELDAELEVMVG